MINLLLFLCFELPYYYSNCFIYHLSLISYLQVDLQGYYQSRPHNCLPLSHSSFINLLSLLIGIKSQLCILVFLPQSFHPAYYLLSTHAFQLYSLLYWFSQVTSKLLVLRPFTIVKSLTLSLPFYFVINLTMMAALQNLIIAYQFYLLLYLFYLQTYSFMAMMIKFCYYHYSSLLT